MRAAYAIWRMLARRGRSRWRLTATLALGVLVAATLLAAAPIYARALADLGLTFAIRERLRTSAATQVQFRNLALSSEEGRALQQAVLARTEQRIGWFAAGRERVVQGPRFRIEGAQREGPPPLAVPWTMTAQAEKLRLLDGVLPGRAARDGALELALSPRAAEAGGLKVGDRITLHEAFDDCERELPREDRPPPPPCTPKTGIRFTVPAVVAGIVEPAAPEDLFWVNPAETLFAPYSLIPDNGPLLPALMDEQALFALLGGVVPEYRTTYSWNYFADPDKLSRANFERARADIIALRDDLRPLDGFAFSPLEGALESFRRELSYQQAPLLLLLLQISAIALFYVGIVAALVIERQTEEIALLRSRGAGRAHILGIYALEGLAIAVPVMLLAPFLAAGMTALLGYTPAFTRVTGGGLLPARAGASAFALAAFGALLSVLMLLLPAFLAAKTTGVTSRRSLARPRAPFFLRYYLDLAGVALAALLLWELEERGSVFSASAAGGLSSDPLLLASPALLTLAAAALVLRFYPMALRLAAVVAARVAGAPVVLGLWQVVRNPGAYTRLALLLMMAVAVGAFAASYSTTAERSFRDRAAFSAGADLRISLPYAEAGNNTALLGTLHALPGVAQATLVARAGVSLASPGVARSDIQMIGVDPAAVPAALWFREDLAPEPLPALMGYLSGPAPGGRPLPGNPRSLTIWVNPAEPREAVTMWVRVRDVNGIATLAELGKLDFSGWRQMRAPLDDRFQPQLTPPLSLVSIMFTEPPNINVVQTAPIYLDDIAVSGPEGTAVVEDFEAAARWDSAPARTPARGAAVQDSFTVSGEQPHGGQSAGKFVPRQGSSTGMRAIIAKEVLAPLPVVVNPEFTGLTGANLGQQTLLVAGDALVPVVVRGVTSLFPTVSGGTPLALVSQAQLSAWLAAFTDSGLRRPNEAWLTLHPDADRAATRKAITQSPERFAVITDREEALREVNRNPLVAAGGSGILLAAALAVFALVAAALLVTVVAAVNRRKTEFAVLRAMGASPGQVFRLLAFEYALVAVLGVGAGLYLGTAIARRMLSFLEVTESGAVVVPPFLLQTEWPMVAAAVGAVALTFIAGMVLSTRAALRQIAAQALRGEG